MFPNHNKYKRPPGLEVGARVRTDINKASKGITEHVVVRCVRERNTSSGWVVEVDPPVEPHNRVCSSWFKVVTAVSSPGAILPTDSAARKTIPLATGCLDYFPRTLAAIAALSFKANEKHNPGEPLHWAREKSSDHRDCLLRHFLDAGPDSSGVDKDGTLHAVEAAWRACAVAELALEKKAKAGKP